MTIAGHIPHEDLQFCCMNMFCDVPPVVHWLSLQATHSTYARRDVRMRWMGKSVRGEGESAERSGWVVGRVWCGSVCARERACGWAGGWVGSVILAHGWMDGLGCAAFVGLFACSQHEPTDRPIGGYERCTPSARRRGSTDLAHALHRVSRSTHSSADLGAALGARAGGVVVVVVLAGGVREGTDDAGPTACPVRGATVLAAYTGGGEPRGSAVGGGSRVPAVGNAVGNAVGAIDVPNGRQLH